jgi:hypothetical protein
MSRLAGRFIINEGDATASQIDSAFGTTFTATSAADHGNLAGLLDDDHTQYMKESVYDSDIDGVVDDGAIDGSAERDEVCGTTDLSSSCEINDGVVGRTEIDETLLSIQTHATDCAGSLVCDAGSDGEMCFEIDANDLYVCDGGEADWKRFARSDELPTPHPTFISETATGSGTAWTLSQTPTAASAVSCSLAGFVLGRVGATPAVDEFTVSGTSVTLGLSAAAGDKVICSYTY